MTSRHEQHHSLHQLRRHALGAAKLPVAQPTCWIAPDQLECGATTVRFFQAIPTTARDFVGCSGFGAEPISAAPARRPGPPISRYKRLTCPLVECTHVPGALQAGLVSGKRRPASGLKPIRDGECIPAQCQHPVSNCSLAPLTRGCCSVSRHPGDELSANVLFAAMRT